MEEGQGKTRKTRREGETRRNKEILMRKDKKK